VPVASPFFFAWVAETETTFGPEHHRMDEYIFSAKRVLTEGEKPKLELVIENPYVGLLSALRQQWAWFAWSDGTTVHPLFFGRVVGIPSDLQAETIVVSLIAWPSNYVSQLQQVAEALKYPPFYDPVFTDVALRDNPLAIFESHSRMIVVDPVTLTVSSSDILDAEDGNVDFTGDDHFYDNLNISPGAVPKTVVHVDAQVAWTQTARGYVDMGNNTFRSYSGDGILGDWPKPGATVAPGLTAFTATAIDASGISNALTGSYSYSWTNTAKEHSDGDGLSTNINQTIPQISGGISQVLTFKQQSGVLDPFATDGNGDPAPLNIPPSLNVTMVYAAAYSVKTSLVLEYQAERPHTERVIFRLFADVQPTTLDPLISEDSETLNISGSDVGMPIVDLLNWTTVAGTAVAVGTVIFPDDPHFPGNKTAQRCITAGTTGTVEPDFSDVAGETTADGSAVWSSLSTAAPTESAPDWTGVSLVPLGATILPRRPIYTTWFAFTQGGRATIPQTGTSVSEGTIIQASNGSFQVCTQGGTTAGGGGGNLSEPAFATSWGATTSDGSAIWKSLGLALPTGSAFFVATTGGTTGAQHVIPPFNNNLNATTSDGSVVWTNIGSGSIPIGGTPGNVIGGSYFASDRGQWSVQHLICRARARLRYASRAVTTSFDTSFARGIGLTLRKSVTLHDPRLPGGIVLGKITGVEMSADQGVFTTRVTMQSALGKATEVVEVPGEPTYVADGYVTDGYQQRTGHVVLLPVASDVGYSPLVPIADEDGVRFPLDKNMIVVSEGFIGSTLEEQETAVKSAFRSMANAAQITQQPPTSFDQSIYQQTQAQLASANSVPYQLQQHPRYYELELKPLNGNGAFNHVYHLKCTTLALPKMIDLGA